MCLADCPTQTHKEKLKLSIAEQGNKNLFEKLNISMEMILVL